MIMEYCKSDSLQSRIDACEFNKKLKIEDQIEVFIQMCEGIKHFHDQRIIHGNIKASNVFIDKDKIVKLGGFKLTHTSHE